MVLDSFGSWNEKDTNWCEDCADHVLLIDEDVVVMRNAEE